MNIGDIVHPKPGYSALYGDGVVISKSVWNPKVLRIKFSENIEANFHENNLILIKRIPVIVKSLKLKHHKLWRT